MTVNSLDLAALLCSRLCHDMLSPVGALTNGLELLADEKDPAMRQRCFELLEQSARISTDKLKFFRLAFGAAGGFGDMVAVDEARSLIDALAGNNGRIQINWALGVGELPKPAVKVLLNLSQMGIEALVRGGTLDIGAESGKQGSEIVVRASGARVAFDDTVGRALEGRIAPEELTSRTAAAYMIHQIVANAGGMVQFARDDAQLVMGAALPLG